MSGVYRTKHLCVVWVAFIDLSVLVYCTFSVCIVYLVIVMIIIIKLNKKSFKVVMHNLEQQLLQSGVVLS